MSGRAFGAAMMWGFGAIWLLLGFFKGRSVATPVWSVIVIAGVAIVAAIAVLGQRARQLSRTATPPTPEQAAADKRMGKRFGQIFGLEGAAIFVAVLLLNIFHRPDAIICAVAVMVGLHFFPLARLFHAQVYYATGAVGCALGIGGLLIGDVGVRHSVVSVGFALLLWVTCLLVVLPALRSSRQRRANAAF